jgi:hypothetical protein
VETPKPRLLVAMDLWTTPSSCRCHVGRLCHGEGRKPKKRNDCIRWYLRDCLATAPRTEHPVRTNVVALLGILLAHEVTMGDLMFLLILGGGIWLAIAITQLRADLTELADTVHAAFCASVTANY